MEIDNFPRPTPYPNFTNTGNAGMKKTITPGFSVHKSMERVNLLIPLWIFNARYAPTQEYPKTNPDKLLEAILLKILVQWELQRWRPIRKGDRPVALTQTNIIGSEPR
jgi:hypothetical protein